MTDHTPGPYAHAHNGTLSHVLHLIDRVAVLEKRNADLLAALEAVAALRDDAINRLTGYSPYLLIDVRHIDAAIAKARGDDA